MSKQLSKDFFFFFIFFIFLYNVDLYGMKSPRIKLLDEGAPIAVAGAFA